MADEPLFQIGDVADAVGLSLRTIRHYDEIGVVVPSARSAGGFRLYTGADVERFRFVKKLKPLGFTLDEVQSMVAAIDAVKAGTADTSIYERLEVFALMAEERIAALSTELDDARIVASGLRNPEVVPSPVTAATRRKRTRAPRTRPPASGQEANGSR